jgi:hypothetical protein
VEDDVKSGRRRTEAAKREKEKLDGRIHDFMLDNDSAARSLKAVVKTKEELLITENFVRLDVKRLRGILCTFYFLFFIFGFLSLWAMEVTRVV